jgi:hypothetical protein
MIDVTVIPRTEESARWLLHNLLELRKAFVEVHDPRRDSSTKPHHSHGFQLYLCDEHEEAHGAPFYIITNANKNQVHGDRTIEDFKEALRRLGADLPEFEIGRTKD